MRRTLVDQLELLRCYYSFIRPHGTLRFGIEIRTPAMQAGLARRKLRFRDVFTAAHRALLFALAGTRSGAYDQGGGIGTCAS